MPEKIVTKTDAADFRVWTPDFKKWPDSWMGVNEDLEYGKNLLPYFEGFLQWLYEQGIARKTFVQYRDSLWLLGGSIIRQVSVYEEYDLDPLEKLYGSVVGDGMLPDGYDMMAEAELAEFSRMCRKMEKFFGQQYGAL
jgi:hypothetical protein